MLPRAQYQLPKYPAPVVETDGKKEEVGLQINAFVATFTHTHTHIHRKRESKRAQDIN